MFFFKCNKSTVDVTNRKKNRERKIDLDRVIDQSID